jgi:3D (Asp-Asp-Asp) domain-containing protein
MIYIQGIGLKFVNDTMNKRWKQRLDVFVETYDDEKRFDQKFKGKKLKIWIIKIPNREK